MNDSPIKKLAFILEKFGWNTRFCDLSEEQVHTLIFALQEDTGKLSEEIDIGILEEKYFKSTGVWPSTSVPF